MSNFLGKVDKSIFGISAIVCIIFVLWTVITPESAGNIFSQVQGFFTTNFGWLYALGATAFLAGCLLLAFSKYGQIKLGKDDEQPEYSTFNWFAMLFCAGMGIGLVFWSVAEPITHYLTSPLATPQTPEAAELALRYTYFHWGLHPWAVYGVVGMALAYFQFRKGLPALCSSTFHPILGDEGIKGPIGKFVDILAVFATIFGVATSLGMGAMQINAGLNHLYGITDATSVAIGVILIVTALYTLSAVTGINRGIRILSSINLVLAVALMLFVLLVGPTRFIFNSLVETTGQYLQNIIWMSFFNDQYGTVAEHVGGWDWVGGWTIFYWAWWIAWGPFVGGFIARISRGRTIKEFVFGVLLAPTLFTFIWFAILGGTALNLDQATGGAFAPTASTTTSALFVLLSQFPAGAFFCLIAICLVAIFFITSADSATFVVSMYTSGGDLEPKAGMKIFWGVIEGAVAAVLLLAGGLSALQTASIAAAFPFMIVMFFMIYCMVKAFKQEFSGVSPALKVEGTKSIGTPSA